MKHNFFEHFKNTLTEWADDFIEATPNIVLAIVVFTLGYYFSVFIKKSTLKILAARQVKRTARAMVANLVSLVIVSSFLFISLGILKLDGMLKTILAGAGVAGLAIGLALQGTLSNTFAGVFLSFRNDLHIGDQIETNGYTGKIEEINLRYTKLRTPDGNLTSIPNKLLIENPFKNYSDKTTSIIILTCGVAYNSDLELVKKLVIQTIYNLMEKDFQESDIKFFFTEFGDSSINFELRFPALSKSIAESAVEKSKAIIAIKKTFDANNINIPFPIRTLDIPKNLTL